MKKAKRVVLVTLVVVNLGLLVGLVEANLPPAQAAPFKTTDYVVVTGRVSSSLDAIYVIDLATQQMAAFTWDKTTKRMRSIGRRRELPADFKVKAR